MNKLKGFFAVCLALFMITAAFSVNADDVEETVVEDTAEDIVLQASNETEFSEISLPFYSCTGIGVDGTFEQLYDGSVATFSDKHIRSECGILIDLGNKIKISDVVIKSRGDGYFGYTGSLGYLEIRGTNNPDIKFSEMTLLGRLASPTTLENFNNAPYEFHLATAVTNESTGELNQFDGECEFRYIMVGRVAEYAKLTEESQISEIEVKTKAAEAFSPYTITKDNEEITSKTLENGLYVFKLTVYNQHPTEAKRYVPVAAAYDGDGNLIKISTTRYTVRPNGETSCFISIQADDNTSRITATLLKSAAEAEMLVESVDLVRKGR